MTVFRTAISWTNATWNLTTGCHPVSAGCVNCYAEALTQRWGRNFRDIVLHPERLADVTKFKAIRGTDGLLAPPLVFVNSMSDFWHDKIPAGFIHRALDQMEDHEQAVFQILTKRPIRARKLLIERYGPGGLPPNIWIGVSVEDNIVRARLDTMRKLKDRLGSMTMFASVEPIIGPTDQIDFTDVDWVITGGESGRGARLMQRDWLMTALENASRAEAALWHKQAGQALSHPNLDQVPAELRNTAGAQTWLLAHDLPPKRGRAAINAACLDWLTRHGWEHLPHEKGGATVDRQTYRNWPNAYVALKDKLNRTSAKEYRHE